MSHVQTSVQYRTMHAPNAFGMHPEAARILAMRGFDPEAFARNVANAHGAHIQSGALSGFSLGHAFNGRAPGAPVAPAGASALPAASLRGLGELPYTQVAAHLKQRFGLDPGDTVVEQLLTQAALDWKNFETLHNVLCPVQTETLVAGKYFLFDRAGQRQVVDSRIGPNGEVKEVSRRVSTQNYSTEPRSLQGSVSRLAQALAPTLNQMSSETEFVMSMHDREMERDVADALGNTANYPAGNLVTLGSSTRWNGGASADPVEDVLTVLLAIPARVNHCVFSDLAWSAAQVNTQLQAVLFGRLRAADGILQPAEFAQFFGIDNVWISKHLIERTPGTVERTWSETGAWFGHVNPGRDMLTHSRRFRTRLPGGPNGIHVRPWFDPSGAMGSDKITVTRQDSAVTFVGADFGGRIDSLRIP